jgi:hypothetical protein
MAGLVQSQCYAARSNGSVKKEKHMKNMSRRSLIEGAASLAVSASIPMQAIAGPSYLEQLRLKYGAEPNCISCSTITNSEIALREYFYNGFKRTDDQRIRID